MGLFKKFDTFLNKCVDYIDNRVFTGKFVEDINYNLNRIYRFTYKKSRKVYFFLKRSILFGELITILAELWFLLLKIPFFGVIVALVGETIRIVIKCYSEIFIVFAITFSITILALSWFQTTILFFCIMLIPIVVLDIVCVSALYYCIDRREEGDKISIWKSILFVLRHLRSISFPVITESAITLEALLSFFIIALFLSYAFDYFKFPWSSSILYWFIVLFICGLIFIGLFIISFLSPQTYFIVLLDHLPFHQALQHARKTIKNSLFWYLCFYILLYGIYGFITWHAILSYFYLGLTISFYFAVSSGIFLGYLLRKQFPLAPPPEDTSNIQRNIYILLAIIIVFGCVNYILISTTLIKEYQPLISFIQQQEENYLSSQQIKSYTNDLYGYSLEYPQNWSVYQWQNNSVTFYNNYTDTISGGTWMTITISPFNGSFFNELAGANPGIVVYDPRSKDIITKVTSMTIQNYPAVNYLFTRPGLPYTQYETHYLIHKGSNMYDISFTSVTNDVANYNSDLFTKIVNSFKFTR